MDVGGEEWQNLLHRGDTMVSQKPDRSEEAQVPVEVTSKPLNLVDVERTPEAEASRLI